ncbi:cation:H+ antiporter [Litoreibacter halocynthiae]|uniref:Cation:H+ antiporter n=1 Tax=Litoreibacter halocynthiae TaxID=1242689 RepID=A0A4V3EXH7_9RHOB|nr:calcium/sodium antiporter [Litoreibacter halocynthiae]TDT74035.1 cation:H+ antiporter [Litoreibacter halocynthiae]
MLEFLGALGGLIILLLAGDALVRGAVNLSLRLGIPALIVSLTVVAFGTSAPELLISIQAVIDGVPGLALGNVVGSNTANVLLVLGIPALFYGLPTSQSRTQKSYLQMIAATLLFIAVNFFGPITWVHALVLLAGIALILTDQFRDALSGRAAAAQEEPEGADPTMRGWKIAAYLIVGLIGLPFGASLLVENASAIATRMGVSDTVIGLTLVAVGTSLPELATTVVAAMRKHADVALGNVIGSNIFNLLVIIGIAGLVGPLPVPPAFLRFDLWVMLASSLILFPIVFWHKDLGKRWGFALCALYVIYIVIVLGAEA